MGDDAWWDDLDGERIAELQRVLTPLREPPRPWGDVLAQARFAQTVVPRVREGLRVATVMLFAAAFAAVLALGWWWGQRQAVRVDAVPVAAPVESSTPVIVPTTLLVPVPIIAGDEAVADQARREIILDQFDGLQRRRAQLRQRPTTPAVAQEREAQDRFEAVLQDTARDVKARKRQSDLDVDCILDPALPKCLAPASAGTSELPRTPTSAQVKRALQSRFGPAKTCGPAHGATSGETVKIKLSIEGATGRVTNATPQSPHDTGTLGACVAEALAEARFPRFQLPSMGVVVPVRMP